ncbi:MAG: hypothetical protein ACRD0M_07630, partial [Acidimicrobiales bacterium]
ATSVAVRALSVPIPAGTVLIFGTVRARLSADAAAGATALAVDALPAAIVANTTAVVSNVAVEPFCTAVSGACPAGTRADLVRSDRSRYRSVATNADLVARADVATGSRFDVVGGQSYEATAFLEVESRTDGAYQASVLWFDGTGAVLSQSTIGSLSAVAARTSFNPDVVAPAGAVKGGLRTEWVGATGPGVGFTDSLTFSPTSVTGALQDSQGSWGAQRIVDFSGSTPTEIAAYRSPRASMWPPPDNGIYAPRLARMFGNQVAFTTWLSDGLRVLDVSRPDAPREVGSFVPPAAADPSPQAGAGAGVVRGQVWPNVTLVTGIDIIPNGDSCGLALISDINSGLHVLEFEVRRVGVPPGCGGYWSVAADGGVFAFGDAGFYGSTGDLRLNSPVVGMAPTPSGRGYWLVAGDGGVFAFGDAGFFGSTGDIRLNSPAVGMAPTATGAGYRVAAGDGGVFTFGDASFLGSAAGLPLTSPVAGLAPVPGGEGYWLVGRDGGVFSFGGAPFSGSIGGSPLTNAIVGLAATATGNGYLMVATDGRVFPFGDASSQGHVGGIPLNAPVVGLAAFPR